MGCQKVNLRVEVKDTTRRKGDQVQVFLAEETQDTVAASSGDSLSAKKKNPPPANGQYTFKREGAKARIRLHIAYRRQKRVMLYTHHCLCQPLYLPKARSCLWIFGLRMNMLPERQLRSYGMISPISSRIYLPIGAS